MNTDSLIGHLSATLTDPVAAADSLIGYAAATLSNPAGTADSAIGYSVGRIGPTPGAYVWDGTTFVRTIAQMWNGTEWVAYDVAATD